jgi:hypothetical protein
MTGAPADLRRGERGQGGAVHVRAERGVRLEKYCPSAQRARGAHAARVLRRRWRRRPSVTVDYPRAVEPTKNAVRVFTHAHEQRGCRRRVVLHKHELHVAQAVATQLRRMLGVQ